MNLEYWIEKWFWLVLGICIINAGYLGWRFAQIDGLACKLRWHHWKRFGVGKYENHYICLVCGKQIKREANNE